MVLLEHYKVIVHGNHFEISMEIILAMHSEMVGTNKRLTITISFSFKIESLMF